MPASIGVNLRVTGHCSQGGRKYMEDLFSVAYQQTEDERDLEYAFFGIYDGHGGSEAAAFAKEHLMDSIVKQRQFWSDNDEDVLKAIRNGYMLTHLDMWKELEKWPKTVTGLPSTAGTTASVAFIRRGKIYIGHVGDSAIVLGYQKDGCEEWAAKPLTCDHKPESTAEIERIQRCGGKVVSKAGVPRVVWNRPRLGHKGPIKKNTPMDEIPFLAVARSLGDLWSYNPQNDEFIVSPDPDVGVLTIDPSKFRCLIFGTDGLWNMISPEGAVSLVQATEKHNEAALVGGSVNQPRDWLNPSKSLVDHALERWSNTRMRADNTSVVTLMLDPPGPPRATVLRSRTTQKPTTSVSTNRAPPAQLPAKPEERQEPQPEGESRQVPQNGLTIMTRYSDVDRPAPSPDTPLPPCASIDSRLSVTPLDPSKDSEESEESDTITNYGNPAESYFMTRLLSRSRVVNTLSEVYDEIAERPSREASPPATVVPEAGPAPDAPPAPAAPPAPGAGGVGDAEDGGIQINEVSSSSPVEVPPKLRARRPKDGRREPPNDRVLRSHHEEPQRPHTRQTARPRPPPALDRVVILSRRAPPPPPPPDEEERRTTRSQVSPVPSRATRGLGGAGREAKVASAGNWGRAPGRSRRAPAARRQGGARKENLDAASASPRARAPRDPPPARPPAPTPISPPAGPCLADLVHSTTGNACPRFPLEPRTLRSRNEADSTPVSNKRRCEPPPGSGVPASKASRVGAGVGAGAGAGERGGGRALGKRASGPWAPALALRNRLRRRLAK